MACYRSLHGRSMAINPICMPHVRNSMLANTHTQSLLIHQMEESCDALLLLLK